MEAQEADEAEAAPCPNINVCCLGSQGAVQM